MPVDYRRINGPEESVPYELFTRIKPSSTSKLSEAKQDKQKIINPELDVSSLGAQRKIYLKTGVVNQAKGSAYIETGQTKVLVSVFDPREIPNKTDYALKGEIYCEFKFAPFSCLKRKLHQQDNEEKQFTELMKKALESAVCLHELPNFQVDVYSLVLEDDGSALSAAITAAGVALTEAGVPMYDLITSITLGVDNGVLRQPPFLKELNQKSLINSNSGIMVLSKLNSHKQICQYYQSGYINYEHVKECVKILSQHCDNIVPVVQKCLVKNIVNNLEEKL